MDKINRRDFVIAGAVAATAAAVPVRNATAAPTPVLRVEPHPLGAAVTPAITGTNGAVWFDDFSGAYDPAADRVEPRFVAATRRAGVGLVRYPGGTSSNLFHWRRAVGPQAQRGQQVNGRADADPVDSRYGPDEYMAFIETIGAQPIVMAALADTTPQEIADWVAYMNAPTGTPMGDLRAANGRPAPYGVHYWELGNEMHLRNERYWMSADDQTALRQYALGGTQRQSAQPVGTPVDHRTSAAMSSGHPGQRFTVHFPPVVPGSQSIKVAGNEWQQVVSLDGAGATDAVYAFDPVRGEIAFGDGTHGAIPPAAAQVTADYDSGPHAGFVDYYRAMKAADPTIAVVATWAPLERVGKLRPGTTFPALMQAMGHQDDYDAIALHPYTNFRRDFAITAFRSARQGHDMSMIGEGAAADTVDRQRADVRKHGSTAEVLVTEAGALFFGGMDNDVFSHVNNAMTHALYVASQVAHFMERGLPFACINDLPSEKPGVTRAVFGGPPSFVATADAVVREALSGLVHGHGRVAPVTVCDNPEVATGRTELGRGYPALVTVAARHEDGAVDLLVVNRSPRQPITARVDIIGLPGTRHAQVATVAPASFQSFNDTDHPHDVVIARTSARVTSGRLTHRFPAHSVTVLRARL